MHRYRTTAGKALTLSVMATALAACTTVGPDYLVPNDAVVQREVASAGFASAGEQAFKSDPLPADWWRMYRDPVVRPARTTAAHRLVRG
jgi:predicted small lipoprotein YifL